MIRSGPLPRRACAAAAVAFAILTTAVGQRQGAPLRFLVADGSIGLLFALAGLFAWERRPEVRTGPLLVATSVLWFAGSYGPTGLTPWADLGFAVERMYDPVLAYLALTFPDARLTRPGRVAVGVMAAATLARVASRLLVDCGCLGADHPFAPVRSPVLFDVAQWATSAVVLAAALVVAVLAVGRLRSAATGARRILWPVVAAGCVASLVTAYDAAELGYSALTRQPLIPVEGAAQEIVSWSIIGAIGLVPLGFVVGTWRLRRRAGPIGRLAVALEGRSDLPGLEASLRHALGDPTLELYLHTDDGWQSAAGAVGALPAEDDSRVNTLLAGDGGPVAALVHDRALREDPGLVAAATAVLRLAVENDRLAGVVRRQLDEVRASRARLVGAAAEERRRIERDLHDGAQQRLIAVALALQEAREAARAAAPAAPFLPRIDDAFEELVAAIDELRELARGIHPAILTEEGLRPAVMSLARRSSVAVTVDARVGERLPVGVETAAYYIVAEALTNVVRHARARSAVVELSYDSGALVVSVADDGDGGADLSRGTGLEGLADRLDALSGTLEVDSAPGRGTRVRAVIPCG